MAQPKTSVTIVNGASLSEAFPLGDLTLTGILLPTLTSAAITFKGSIDGVTYGDIFNTAGVVTLAAGTGGVLLALSPNDFRPAGFVKIQSGTTGSPVTQGADRVITLAFREIS